MGRFFPGRQSFLYYAAPAENRTRYMALSNALVFAGASIGSLLGGIMAPIVPAIMRNSLLTIFLISGLLRIVIVFIFRSAYFRSS